MSLLIENTTWVMTDCVTNDWVTKLFFMLKRPEYHRTIKWTFPLIQIIFTPIQTLNRSLEISVGWAVTCKKWFRTIFLRIQSISLLWVRGTVFYTPRNARYYGSLHLFGNKANKNLAYFVFLKYLFWDSPFLLITDALRN